MTARIGSRTRLVVIGVIVLLVLLTAAEVARRQLGADPVRVSARFDSSVGVYKGSDVRVLGVKVGKVTKVVPHGTSVVVDLKVDPDVPIAADTRAVVVAPTLVADRFVQLTEPWSSGPKLATGTTIPRDRTATPVEIDRLYESVDEVARLLGPEGANKDGALSEVIKVASANLDGNGQRTRKLLTDLGGAARTLSDTGADTFATVENLDKLAGVLKKNDGHVRQVDTKLARVTRTLAADRQTMAEALRELSAALGEVDVFVRANREQLTRSVDRVSAATEALAQGKAVLGRVLATLPTTLHGLLAAYDSDRGVLVGRGNPNDVTLGPPAHFGVESHEPPTLPFPMPGDQP